MEIILFIGIWLIITVFTVCDLGLFKSNNSCWLTESLKEDIRVVEARRDREIEEIFIERDREIEEIRNERDREIEEIRRERDRRIEEIINS